MVDLTTISALLELEALKVQIEPVGDDNVKLSCPMPEHADSTPSLILNIRKNLWNCKGCGAKGNIISLLAHFRKIDYTASIVDLSSRYDLETVKVISPKTIESAHEAIWDSGFFIDELRKRGITETIIRDFRIGFRAGRITIPVYDTRGRCVNIRRYLPGAPSDKKMLNTRGFGGLKLFNQKALENHQDIWFCGGELKAALVDSLLHEYGYGAVGPTGGEGSWEPLWGPLLAGRRVWLCLDVDAAGRAAAARYARLMASCGVAEVRIILLPLDAKKHPKGDVNDFIGIEHKTALDLKQLAEDTPLWEVPKGEQDADERGERNVKLGNATDPKHNGFRVAFEGVITALDPTPFLVPKTISVGCDRRSGPCMTCPVHNMEADEGGYVQMTIPSWSPSLLDMIGAGKLALPKAIREGLSVPACKTFEAIVRTRYQVSDTRLAPQLEIGGENAENKMQPAMLVGNVPDMNVPYRMSGRAFPHPKTQQAALVVDVISESEDSLQTFDPSDEDLEALRVFQAGSEESAHEAYDRIQADITNNVTQIYGRNDLLSVIDLTFHSPLFIKYRNRRVNGWMQAIVVGDSGQGKTETFLRLQEHYGLGERVECKNATVAGLLGGLQKMNDRWFVSWGVIPMHDKRLVCLEEIKGADPEVIAKLTDMRSSGIAEIPKIERRRAHARTRLLMLSNARGNRPMAAYAHGVEAIKELVPALEDIRRFDIGIIVSSKEVNVDDMDSVVTPHLCTNTLSRRLVLWAWTRTMDQIVLVQGAEAEIDSASRDLAKTYDDSLPLIDRGTVRHKLLRLASAMAARVFSTDDLRTLIVKGEHVRFAKNLLDRIYSSNVSGYLAYSEAKKVAGKLENPDDVRRYILTTRHPKALVEGLLSHQQVTSLDIQDLTGWDREDSAQVLSFLVRKHALRRGLRSYYRKTPGFIGLLKEMLKETETEPIPDGEESTEEFTV